jgi:acyl-CoA reductase-like NAD-dependent aldehyde dehydrogenase
VDLIERDAIELGTIKTTDSGKLAAETQGQTAYLADYYRYYAGLAEMFLSATKVGPLATKDQRDHIKSVLADSLAQGAEIITGGGHPQGFDPQVRDRRRGHRRPVRDALIGEIPLGLGSRRLKRGCRTRLSPMGSCRRADR